MPTKVDEHGLTPKRRLFADTWLSSRNGEKSAIAAGYSPKRATITASELLKDPLVAAYIAKRQVVVAQKLGIDHERYEEEVAALAFSDITEIFTDVPTGAIDDSGAMITTPGVLPMKDWPATARKAIKSVKVRRVDPVRLARYGSAEYFGYEILEFALWDKTSSLEKVRDMLGDGEPEKEAMSDKERLERIATILARANDRKKKAAR